MTVRLDKWLWSVRAYKTRTRANEACASGRVTVNGAVAKPATKIVIGDLVEARRRERTIVFRVVEAIDKRVSASRAAECIEDLSPPEIRPPSSAGDFARRERGAGRPTKRDRRDIERLRRNGRFHSDERPRRQE